jgi:integrase
MLDKAKLRDMRFHDIRHSFASLLLSNGESPVYVKEQLGHSSIQMTVDIYGHLIPSSNRQAVNALDEHAPKRTPSAPAQNEKAATR